MAISSAAKNRLFGAVFAPICRKAKLRLCTVLSRLSSALPLVAFTRADLYRLPHRRRRLSSSDLRSARATCRRSPRTPVPLALLVACLPSAALRSSRPLSLRLLAVVAIIVAIIVDHASIMPGSCRNRCGWYATQIRAGANRHRALLGNSHTMPWPVRKKISNRTRSQNRTEEGQEGIPGYPHKESADHHPYNPPRKRYSPPPIVILFPISKIFLD